MSFETGWNLTIEERHQLHLLEWIYHRSSGRPGRYIIMARPQLDLFIQEKLGTMVSLGELIESLSHAQLIHYFVRTGEMNGVPPRLQLTRDGMQLIEGVLSRQADTRVRKPAVRDALLRWLYEQTDEGEHEIGRFWQSCYAQFYISNQDFTPAEVSDAVRWLNENKYVTGAPDVSGSWIRLSLTRKGERFVENNRSTSKDSEPAGENISVINSTGVNIANRSSGSYQSNSIALDEEGQQKIRTVADFLEQFCTQLGLPEEQTARVPELVADLRAITQESAPERGKVKRLLDSTRELAIAAVSIPLGAGLQAMVLEAAHSLGLA